LKRLTPLQTTLTKWPSFCGGEYVGIVRESFRGAKPLFYYYFPLFFEGEGDKGGEVDNTMLFGPDRVKSGY